MLRYGRAWHPQGIARFGSVATPAITGFSPSAADVGNQVTITGSGFGASRGIGSVLFTNTAASFSNTVTVPNILSWSDTQIVVKVPDGVTFPMAGSFISVVTNSSQQANSAATFTWNFSPASTAIAGLKLWLKADAIPAQTDGTGVASWPDSSGNGVSVTQPTGVNQPLYKTGIINGLPVVRGATGTGFSMNLADAALSHSLFTVCNPTGTSGYILDTAVGRMVVSPAQGSGLSKAAYFDGAWHEFGPSVTNTWQVCDWILNSGGNTGAVYRNGVSLANTLGGATFTGKAIGGLTAAMAFNTGTNTGFIGDVAEILAYTGALSTADRQTVESYLNRKYLIF